jgi:hypothetical protein
MAVLPNRGMIAICRSVGGRDAAAKPPWMDLRRLRQAVNIPRPMSGYIISRLIPESQGIHCRKFCSRRKPAAALFSG